MKWRCMIISLPPSPYLPKNATELRNATDVLNEWCEQGWEPVGIIAPYEILLKRTMPSALPPANEGEPNAG